MHAGSSARDLRGHEDTVVAIGFEPLGTTLATGGMDGSVRLWDVETGAVRGTMDGPTEAIEFLTWHPKGKVVLAGCEDMTAWMFNTEQQLCMHVFSGHTGPVTAGASVAPPSHCCATLVMCSHFCYAHTRWSAPHCRGARSV
jgi:angio-associated migratory cell protein